jgi:ABC-type branched-subunit amino acid transport system ATPase component
MEGPEGNAVRLRNLRKVFGRTEAVADVELGISDGEFFSMLGPSGSGKTTVLRMIAGFETPTSGTVELGGEDVTGLAPFERDVHTVFQDYALFPHMTVEQNVAYGLKIRKVPKAERLRRAGENLKLVKITGLDGRIADDHTGRAGLGDVGQHRFDDARVRHEAVDTASQLMPVADPVRLQKDVTTPANYLTKGIPVLRALPCGVQLRREKQFAKGPFGVRGDIAARQLICGGCRALRACIISAAQ